MGMLLCSSGPIASQFFLGWLILSLRVSLSKETRRLCLRLSVHFRTGYALNWSIPTVAGLGPLGIISVFALSAPTTRM